MKSCRCISGLLLVALLMLIDRGASAQPKAWESIGPEGGRIVTIAQDPTNVNILLTSPYGYPSRIFKSTNRGVSWSELGSISENIVKLVFDPLSGNIVYACATSSVHRSTNGGQNWTRYALPSSSGVYYYASDIAIDPVNPANIHLGCYAYDGANSVPAYVRSTDAGAHWTGLTLAAEPGAAQGVTVDPVNPQNVYLGGYQYTGSTYTPKVYRSTNGGVSFVDKSGTIAGAYIYDICADPVGGGKIYAASVAGVYRTTDAGETWTALGFVPVPYRLAISNANPSVLYAAASTGVPYKTTNAGTTWTAVGSGITGSGYNEIFVESGANPYVYFGNNSSIFRTTNAGTSWQSCCSGMKSASITALCNAPSAPATVFAAFLNNAVFKSTAASGGTVTWQQLPDFYSCINIEDIVISPSNPDKLYAMEGGT